MAHLLTDELWHEIQPLLPSSKPRPRGGRKPVEDRVAPAGILLVLKTGIAWEDLPREIGCSGMTCWRRLRDWQAAGVWQRLHELFLAKLRQADRIDFSRVLADSGTIRAVLGDRRPAPIPPIAANSAANIILWSKLTGFRWRRSSPALTAMTVRS